jgi:uncharacterized protein (TIGR01244 family)
MLPLRAIALLLLLALWSFGCASARPPANATLSPEIAPLKTMERGRIVVASQPSLADLRALSASGVTDVVNLRSDDEMHDDVPFDERAAAAQLGLRYTQIPIDWSAHPYRPEVVRGLTQVLASSHGKVLLHCASGGRAGYVWAAYAVAQLGQSPDAALRSLEPVADWPMALEKLTGVPLRVVRAEPAPTR